MASRAVGMEVLVVHVGETGQGCGVTVEVDVAVLVSVSVGVCVGVAVTVGVEDGPEQLGTSSSLALTAFAGNQACAPPRAKMRPLPVETDDR